MNNELLLSLTEDAQFIDIMNNDIVTESKIEYINDKGENVPKVCPKCGAKVSIFLRGEPVFLCSCKDCGKYFGTVPCNL